MVPGEAHAADDFAELGGLGGLVIAGGLIVGAVTMSLNAATFAEGGSMPAEFRDIGWGFAVLNLVSSLGGFIGASFVEPLETAALIYGGAGVVSLVGLLGCIFAGLVRTYDVSDASAGLRAVPLGLRF